MSNIVKTEFLNLLTSKEAISDQDISALILKIKEIEYSTSFNNPTMEDILKNFFKGYIAIQRYRIINKDISNYDVFNIQEYSLRGIESLSKKETLELSSKNLYNYLFLIGFFERKEKENIIHEMIVDFFDLIL